MLGLDVCHTPEHSCMDQYQNVQIHMYTSSLCESLSYVYVSKKYIKSDAKTKLSNLFVFGLMLC